MPQKQYQVAIIGRSGAGNYGHSLDMAFVGHQRARVVAVADPDEAGAIACAARTGADHIYVDYRRMIAEVQPDIVVVAPRYVDCHLDMVLASVQAGAHVYCEKPMAQDLEQADRMIEAAELANVKFGIALPFAHEPRAAQLKSLLQQGLIGDIVSLRGISKCDHRGGGQEMIVLGLHFADMMRRIAGDAVSCWSSVSYEGQPARLADAKYGEEEVGMVAGDEILAQYQFTSGLTGSIETQRLNIEDRTEHPYRLEIQGTKGIFYVRAPYADHSIWHYARPYVNPYHTEWQRIETQSIHTYGAYHQLAAEDFIKSIEEDRSPLCSGYDGRAALEMVLASYVSHLEARRVTIPLASRHHPLVTLLS